MMKLNLHLVIDADHANIPSEQHFTVWLKQVLERRCQQAEISMTIVDEKKMRQINFESRGVDRSTNTLAFSYPQEGAALPMFGEIVMCAAVIEKETMELGVEKFEHWAHLTTHSCLHLLGYEHDNADDANTMENLETEIMNTLGFDAPYETGENDD